MLIKTDFRFLAAVPVSQCHHLVLLWPPPPCGQSCSLLQYPETACHTRCAGYRPVYKMAYNKNNPIVPLLNLAQLTRRGLRVCSYLRDSVKPSEEFTAEEKTVQRGRYCLAVAGDVHGDNQEGMLGVWPCVAIQDCGDEMIGVQYTADGKRGTVQRDVVLLHPLFGMVVNPRTIDPVSHWHQEGSDDGADDSAPESDSGDNAAHKGTSKGGGGAEPMNVKGKQNKALRNMKKKGTGSASADSDSDENGIPQDKKKSKKSPKNKPPKKANQPQGQTMGLAG